MKIPAQATVDLISPMLWQVNVRAALPLSMNKSYRIFAKSDDEAAKIGLERFESEARKTGTSKCQ